MKTFKPYFIYDSFIRRGVNVLAHTARTVRGDIDQRKVES